MFTRNLRTRLSTIAGLSPASSKLSTASRVKRALAVRARGSVPAARRLKGSRRESPFAFSDGDPIATRGAGRKVSRATLGHARNGVKAARCQSRFTRAVRPVGRRPGRRSAGSSIRTDASRGPGRLERDHPAVVGQQAADAIGPFDQADAVAAPVVGDAQVFKGLRILQPVGIEVVDRQAAFVLVDQDERGARDRRGIDPERFGDGPHQPGLAGSERADQADDDARLDQLGDGAAQPRGLVLRFKLDRQARLPVLFTSMAVSLTCAEMIEAHRARSVSPGRRDCGAADPASSVTVPTR